MLSRVIVGARDILIITPLATILGTILGTALGLAMGYLGGASDLVAGRIVEAFLALPFVIIAFLFVVALGPSVAGITVIIGLVFTPLIAHGPRRGAGRAEHGLRACGPAAGREPGPGHVRRDPAQRHARHPGRVHGPAGLRGLRRGHAVLPRLRHPAATPDWGADIAANYVNLTAGYWWQTLFPALAIASLVTAVILIADSIEQVLAS